MIDPVLFSFCISPCTAVLENIPIFGLLTKPKNRQHSFTGSGTLESGRRWDGDSGSPSQFVLRAIPVLGGTRWQALLERPTQSQADFLLPFISLLLTTRNTTFIRTCHPDRCLTVLGEEVTSPFTNCVSFTLLAPISHPLEVSEFIIIFWKLILFRK